MAVRVKLPTILRKHAGGDPLVDAQGATLRELLSDLERRYPGITKNVVTPDGGLHRFVNVYVNDEDVRFLAKDATPLRDDDVLAIVPTIAGGLSC